MRIPMLVYLRDGALDCDLSNSAAIESNEYIGVASIPNKYITQNTISESFRLKEYQKRAQLLTGKAAGIT